MSDLLSPILFVMKDEQESFWCFAALMERLGPNFNRDQAGMHSQLFALSKLVELLDSPLHNYFKQNDCLNYFFCFRWVLIQFKRLSLRHRSPGPTSRGFKSSSSEGEVGAYSSFARMGVGAGLKGIGMEKL
ncbi:hypothetical protein MKW94_009337, partial [Papaver nudicaule]|nr:hypothetical protein [Papaver nudicaule]